MHLFKELAESLTPCAEGFSSIVPTGWKQGRTAYGGAMCALSYIAAQNTFANLPPLRSFQTTFVGPVGENPIFTPQLLRQGKNVTSVSVDIVTDDQNVGRTSFIFGKARQSFLTQTGKAPDAPMPEDAEYFAPKTIRDKLPGFVRNFDMRLIAGNRPLSGAKNGYIRAWCRHEDEWARDKVEGFICLGDVLPPAAMPMFKSFGPVSSVNWQVNIIEPELTTQDGWWHLDTTLNAARDGYASQTMRYWNIEGRLIAEAIQTVAIFI